MFLRTGFPRTFAFSRMRIQGIKITYFITNSHRELKACYTDLYRLTCDQDLLFYIVYLFLFFFCERGGEWREEKPFRGEVRRNGKLSPVDSVDRQIGFS